MGGTNVAAIQTVKKKMDRRATRACYTTQKFGALPLGSLPPVPFSGTAYSSGTVQHGETFASSAAKSSTARWDLGACIMWRLVLLVTFTYSAHGMCPVNQTIELVFPHVPKAGGRTIEATFEGDDARRGHRGRHLPVSNLPRSLSHNFRIRKAGHAPYSWLAKSYGCNFQSDGIAVGCTVASEDCAPFVFILRDPVQRFLSAFYTTAGRNSVGHFACQRHSAAWRMLRNPASTIEDWARLPERERRRCNVDDRHVWFLASDKMGDYQLETAKRRLKSMPWFGILERMPESLHLFRYALHTELVRTTPTFNLNKYNKTLSSEALRVIQEHNHLDLQLYDYAVEEFNRRVEEAGGQIPTVTCDEDVLCWDRLHSTSRQWSLQDAESAMKEMFLTEGEAKDNTLCAPRTGCLIEYHQNRKLSSPHAQPRNSRGGKYDDRDNQ